ncbi:MAG: metallopeptidase family protein [Myxococcales bacterium]|nr:metallopeptidase family protein [Myxococcales bacterium]
MAADLERGFLALEEGELDAAEAALDRARRVDRRHPDVLLLGAAVSDARGDVDEALAQYRALSEDQKDAPMPRLCIARLELHGLGEPEAALATLAEVFDFIDEEADLVEAIYLKTEALLELGDADAAREALAELSTSAIDDAELALDLSELALAAEDPLLALRWAESAKTIDADAAADAWHLIGRIHEADDKRDLMIAAWQEVRKLDAAAPPPELEVSDDEVEQITLATLAELPANIRAHLEKVPILIDTAPDEHLVADGFDPRMLGLFQGTPLPESGSGTPAITNILLFKTNLARFARDEDDLTDEIRITVLHETAHYFGLDEEDLEKIGLD